MGGILGFGGTNAKQSRAAGSLKFQSSQKASVIPLVYGTNRLTPNLLDYDDFMATPTKGASGKGGKGGVLGGGKGGSQQYTYSASFILGLCQGPIASIGSAWWDKNEGSLAGLESVGGGYAYVHLGVDGGDGSTDGSGKDQFWEANHGYKALSYSGTANIVFGDFTLGNTATLPNFSFEIVSLFTDGSNGSDANPATIITDFLTNPRYGAGFPAANLDSLSSLQSYCAALGIQLSPKIDAAQEAQQYLANIVQLTNSAIVWSGGLLKIIPYGDMPVTNAFTIANFTGAPTPTGGDTINLTFTDPNFNGGATFTVSYTTVSNLQLPAAMAGLAAAVNAAGISATYPGGLGITAGIAAGGFGVMIVQANPPGSTSFGAIGGGGIGTASFVGPNTFSFTPPNMTPIYNLGENDYIVQESSVGISLGVTPGGPALRSGATPITGGFVDDPLHITRSTPADATNYVQIQCANRGDSYNNEIAEAFDQGSIDLYGVRRGSSVQGDAITDPYYVGGIVAQLILQRSILYRNTYTFQLGWKCILLEPMDLVQISDARLGANAVTVRITSVEEDDEGMLTITAEDFFGAYSPVVLYPSPNFVPQPTPTILGLGGGTAAATNKQTGGPAVGGSPSSGTSPPGSVNTPIIFEPTAALLSGDLEVWIAASGGPSYGGCDVYMASTSGGSYGYVGTIIGNSTMGTLSAALASYSGANPDTVDTLSVDLTESRGQLTSFSMGDAAKLIPLCYVDGEFIAYQNANLASAYHYNLTTSLYRSLYGSTGSAHNSGTNFAYLLGVIGRFPYPITMIGETIYLKFLAFNQLGTLRQTLADVSPYTYTITGAGQAALTLQITGSVSGKPGAGAVLQTYVFSAPYTLAVGMEGSFASAGTSATATATFKIEKNGVQVGSMIFAALPATTATFTMSTATSFSPGDALTVIAPGSQDSTLANIGWTFIATN